jgi:hypothetical protein
MPAAPSISASARCASSTPSPTNWCAGHCLEGPQEWVYTEVTFRLEWKEGQTFVVFAHTDWKEPVEFMHHCSTKWATFLLSLREFVERGAGHPAPRDVKIHVGD